MRAFIQLKRSWAVPGRIGKVAFYNAVLSQAQITAHWQARAEAGTISTPDALYLCRQLADGTYGMAEIALG